MIHESIYTEYPSVKEIHDNSDGSLEAFDADGVQVSLDQSWVDAETARLQTGYDSQDYARKRRLEYNKLNQDEMRFDDLTNSTTTWQDAIVAIKDKYPKGEL